MLHFAKNVKLIPNKELEYYRNIKLKRDQLFENVKKFFKGKANINPSIQLKNGGQFFLFVEMLLCIQVMLLEVSNIQLEKHPFRNIQLFIPETFKH
jgi:hypothetical protein